MIPPPLGSRLLGLSFVGVTLACLTIRVWSPRPTVQKPVQAMPTLLHQLWIQPETPQVPPQTIPVRLPTTSLARELTNQFVLRGTVMDDEPMALIEDRTTGQMRSYRIGEPLGEAVLEVIERGIVWLAHGRTRIPLHLSPPAAHNPTPVTAQATPTAFEVARATVAPALDAQQRMRGVRIAELAPGHPLVRLGLREDDVILAVNGQRLISPQKTLAALHAAARRSNVSLLIERAGAMHRLAVRIP